MKQKKESNPVMEGEYGIGETAKYDRIKYPCPEPAYATNTDGQSATRTVPVTLPGSEELWRK